jgi:hypothetical protein
MFNAPLSQEHRDYLPRFLQVERSDQVSDYGMLNRGECNRMKIHTLRY